MWNAVRRVVRSSDHHGLDQHEALRRGTDRQRIALREFRVEVTHFSGSTGEGSIGRAWRWGRIFSMSKRFQFGTGRERGVLGYAIRRETGR